MVPYDEAELALFLKHRLHAGKKVHKRRRSMSQSFSSSSYVFCYNLLQLLKGIVDEREKVSNANNCGWYQLGNSMCCRENVVGVEEGYVLCAMYLSVVVDEEFGTEEIIKLSLGLAFAGRGIGSQLQNARVALR